MVEDNSKSCTSCGSTIKARSVICPNCEHDLARASAEPVDEYAGEKSGTEFRKSTGFSVFLVVISAILIAGSGLIFSMAFMPGMYVGPAGFAIITILFFLGLWTLYSGIRSARFKAVLSSGSLLIGKHNIPLRNVRFSSSESVHYRTGTRTSSFTIYYRNKDAKGAVLIPGSIRDSQALIEALQELVTPGDSKYELKLHCPYCGSTHEGKAFAPGAVCPVCEKIPAHGVTKIDAPVRRRYTVNRVGSWVVGVIVVVFLAVYFSFTPRLWDGLGGTTFILLSLFAVVALLFLWGTARVLYAHEKRYLEYVDVLRPVAKTA